MGFRSISTFWIVIHFFIISVMLLFIIGILVFEIGLNILVLHDSGDIHLLNLKLFVVRESVAVRFHI